jgi:hypothetical protein
MLPVRSRRLQLLFALNTTNDGFAHFGSTLIAFIVRKAVRCSTIGGDLRSSSSNLAKPYTALRHKFTASLSSANAVISFSITAKAPEQISAG